MLTAREERRRELGKELLNEVAGIIYGDRNRDYGDAVDDFTRVANMSGAYHGIEKGPTDHSADMIMVKLSRLKHSPDHKDSWLDIIGYAVLAYSMAIEEAEYQASLKAIAGSTKETVQVSCLEGKTNWRRVWKCWIS